jgi:hypothetical protein
MHEDHHEVHDDLVQVVEAREQALARSPRHRERQAEETREDDDLEHVALCHRPDRIRGKQADDRVAKRRGLRGLVGGIRGEVESRTGLHQHRSRECQGDRDGGRGDVERERLAPDAAEPGHVLERRGTAHQGHEDERHHQELQRRQEDLAACLEESTDQVGADGPLRFGEIEGETHDEAQRHPQEDATRESATRSRDQLQAEPPWSGTIARSNPDEGRANLAAWKPSPSGCATC